MEKGWSSIHPFTQRTFVMNLLGVWHSVMSWRYPKRNRENSLLWGDIHVMKLGLPYYISWAKKWIFLKNKGSSSTSLYIHLIHTELIRGKQLFPYNTIFFALIISVWAQVFAFANLIDAYGNWESSVNKTKSVSHMSIAEGIRPLCHVRSHLECVRW